MIDYLGFKILRVVLFLDFFVIGGYRWLNIVFGYIFKKFKMSIEFDSYILFRFKLYLEFGWDVS